MKVIYPRGVSTKLASYIVEVISYRGADMNKTKTTHTFDKNSLKFKQKQTGAEPVYQQTKQYAPDKKKHYAGVVRIITNAAKPFSNFT